MSQERLTDLMFGLIWPPTTPLAIRQSVIDTLTELEALRGKEKGLTEDEYAGWRTSILDELATNRHPESVFLFACGVFGVILTGLLVYGLLSGNTKWVWVAGLVLVAVALLALRLARGLVAKKRLPVAERLGLVEELLGLKLLSAEEAVKLREQIEQLRLDGLS